MGEKLSGSFDIRIHKTEFRKKYKQLRTDMPLTEKKIRDEKIFQKLINLEVYKKSNVILTYVSTAIEVDTIEFIRQALSDNKTVAVPRCVNGTRDMIFYIIKSFEDLETGAFSVREPIPEKCAALSDFDDAFCIVPALVYDRYGYRLGYGKGYYDRFLSAHPNMHCVGISYCCCTVTKLVHGKFDVAVSTLITEKYVKNCRKEEVLNGAERTP